ncbi:hypothetical protein N0V90_004586 [Kalmusia sp. IMI 367209]|nr:hypothetical protein N0V90_004586 [Kalmusia sp. IMI 367209]
MSPFKEVGFHKADPDGTPRPTSQHRASLRPAPIAVNQGAGFDGNCQPRIGPLPPTPRKRKEPPTLFESRLSFAQKKRLALRSSTISVVKRVKVGDLAITMRDDGENKVDSKAFRFLDLPPELRNQIYCQCIDMSQKQALVIHRPRMATLRSSTRQGRANPGRYCEPEDPDKKRSPKAKQLPPKQTNRPFVGLTQVNRQIRREFYTTYMSRQEIGMDFTDCSKYMATYFDPNQPICLQGPWDIAGKNMPFQGNITIAVSRKILPAEKQLGWIDALPLLTTWANSVHIEAGFGRYSSAGYIPQRDGEAKDLYRLYGRKVLPDRSCSTMNPRWRIVLRSRHLAAVRIVREPGEFPRPYFHLIWKYGYREAWMRQLHSSVPGTVDAKAVPGSWLWDIGFDRMEHFDVRVGGETYEGEISN